MKVFSDEIWDMILDQLHQDKITLRKCSLVTREWLPTCRYHIFFDLVLRISEKRCETDVFSNPNCGFLPYVRELTIRSGLSWHPSQDKFIPSLPIFPCVTAVKIVDITWTMGNYETFNWTLKHLERVTNLTIFDSSFEHSNAGSGLEIRLATFISAAPLLVHLCIKNTSFTLEDPLSDFLAPKSLRKIIVASLPAKDCRNLLKWLRPSSHHIEEFRIVDSEGMIDGTLPFFGLVSSQLRRLTLQANVSDIVNGVTQGISQVAPYDYVN